MGLKIYAFQSRFLDEKMNLLDIFIILIAILFTILDMNIKDDIAGAVFRLRGIFRLLRVALLIRKLDELKKSKKAKNKYQVDYSDYKSPLERTLEILSYLRDDLQNQKYVKDVNF